MSKKKLTRCLLCDGQRENKAILDNDDFDLAELSALQIAMAKNFDRPVCELAQHHCLTTDNSEQIRTR